MRPTPAVSQPALRAHLTERLHLVTLGYYSPADRVAHQILPTLTGDAAPIVTSIHESIHRDLAISTDVGLVESLLAGVMSRGTSETGFADTAREVLELVVAETWWAHESTATYTSIALAASEGFIDLESYLPHLPADYRAAFDLYAELFRPLEGSVEEIGVSLQLSKVVAQVALNVPILKRFMDFRQVTPAAVEEFLERHNPDRCQRDLIERVGKDETMLELVREGVAFLARNVDQGDGSGEFSWIDFLRRRVRLASRLDLFLIGLVRDRFPDLVWWTSYEEQSGLRRKLFSSWRETWESCGLADLARTADLRSQDSAEDPAREVEQLLDLRSDSPLKLVFQESVFGTTEFVPLELARVGDYMSALESVGSDLLVALIPIPDGDLPHALIDAGIRGNSVSLNVWPWQWKGDDRLRQIARFQRSLIVCAPEQLGEVAGQLSRLETVWIRWQELEKAAGLEIPSLVGGWNLRFHLSSSVRDILQSCLDRSEGGEVGLFFYGDPGADGRPEPRWAGIVEAGTSEVHLHPIVQQMLVLLLAEKIKDRPGIRLWDHHEMEQSHLRDILRDIVEMFFRRRK